MNLQLLDKLTSFSLDDEASEFKFSDRLARENGWSIAYSKRVIEEYKRFLYLSAEAGHPVTPSVDVDEVWHLHLCYTRSYWHDLCRDILDFPLHHGPTKGGGEERSKFNQWYQKTLDSYEEHFNSKPPADIWPVPSVRFARQEIKKVDCQRNLIFSKRAVYLSSGVTGFSLCLLSCVSNESGFPVGIFIFMAIIFILICVFGKSSGGKGDGGVGGSGGIDSGCGGCGGGGCGGCGGCGG